MVIGLFLISLALLSPTDQAPASELVMEADIGRGRAGVLRKRFQALPQHPVLSNLQHLIIKYVLPSLCSKKIPIDAIFGGRDRARVSAHSTESVDRPQVCAGASMQNLWENK